MRTEAAPFSVEDTVAILERTPATLQALLADLPDAWVRTTEGPDTWSPYDVVGHLIHAERTNWLPRARHLLRGERRPFDPFDREGQFKMDGAEPLESRLATFAELRKENIVALRAMPLSEAELSRTGMHPELGEVTLAQLLAAWAVHDLTHTAQIVRTMAHRYADAVGPWREYLSILRARDQSV